MRELKFRGKRIDDGKWEYGLLTIEKGKYAILNWYGNGLFFISLVDSETVGQYTGMKDKNGAEIYEGDIVYFEGGVLAPSTPYGESVKGVVEFKNGCFVVNGIPLAVREFEVIGNVFENPELLERT